MCHKNIILEAIVDQSLWIWHVFLRQFGGNNDINVLNISLFIKSMVIGKRHGLNFKVNGLNYPMYSLLVDNIYPSWN
jgi:hypothetical protein